MNFKEIINWARHNPLAIVSVLLCMASLVFLGYVQSAGSTMIDEGQKRAGEISRLDSLFNTSMVLPPSEVDGPSRVVNGVVNPAMIDYLKKVFGQMQGDYSQIWNLAISHNKGDATRGMHLPMLQGLFPDTGGRDFVLFDARRPYLAAFEEMLGPASEGAQYPRLNAGKPVAREELESALEPLTRNLRARYGLTNEQLTNAQQIELNNAKRKAVLDMLRQNASTMHIYASPQVFQYDDWTNRPRIEDIWESQMNLWIQQDIVQAIARTNNTSDPSRSVISAPIKRINSIRVVPGYVGINTGGGMSPHGGYNTPVNADTKLPNDFSISTTGRLSNSIYDVKHVWVDMDVDVQQLPVFMDQLVKTNFMTILKMDAINVDEYALLNKGYFMGSGDVVNVRMLIETLWLRAWTAPLMPEGVRKLVGITNSSAGSQPMGQ